MRDREKQQGKKEARENQKHRGPKTGENSEQLQGQAEKNPSRSSSPKQLSEDHKRARDQQTRTEENRGPEEPPAKTSAQTRAAAEIRRRSIKLSREEPEAGRKVIEAERTKNWEGNSSQQQRRAAQRQRHREREIYIYMYIYKK